MKSPLGTSAGLQPPGLFVHRWQGLVGCLCVREKGLFVGLDEKSSIASPDTISGVIVANKHYL